SFSNSNFNTLISYENGMPLFALQANNQRVFMLYTAISPAFNNFSNSALFSSILLRSGERSIRKAPISLTLGSSDSYPIKMTQNGDQTITLKKGKVAFIPEI